MLEVLDDLFWIYTNPKAWFVMFVFGIGFIIAGLLSIWVMKVKYTPQITLISMIFSLISLCVMIAMSRNRDSFGIALMINIFVATFFFGHIVSGSPIGTFKKKVKE